MVDRAVLHSKNRDPPMAYVILRRMMKNIGNYRDRKLCNIFEFTVIWDTIVWC